MGIKKQWQSIETAPKDGTVIDVWVDIGVRICDVMWRGGEWVTYDSEYGYMDVEGARIILYWMEQPAPPKEVE